jgi:hypothetical protein
MNQVKIQKKKKWLLHRDREEEVIRSASYRVYRLYLCHVYSRSSSSSSGVCVDVISTLFALYLDRWMCTQQLNS